LNKFTPTIITYFLLLGVGDEYPARTWLQLGFSSTLQLQCCLLLGQASLCVNTGEQKGMPFSFPFMIPSAFCFLGGLISQEHFLFLFLSLCPGLAIANILILIMFLVFGL
jgi:hypothetical protein